MRHQLGDTYAVAGLWVMQVPRSCQILPGEFDRTYAQERRAEKRAL